MSALLPPTAIDALCAATLALGFDPARRALLLAHLPPGYVAALKLHDNPGDQLRADLTALAQTARITGHDGPPLHTWLGNALALAEQHHHPAAETFRRHLTRAPATLRTNLPPPNPFFVGREAALAELHERLTAAADPVALNQPAAAHGHGGVGKTELAIACAWRHLAEWPGGVWFVVADGHDPRQHLARLADAALDPQTAAALPDDTARTDAVLRALTGGPGATLLIVDNLDDGKWFAPWRALVPARGPLRLLVTTRAPCLPGLPAHAMLRVDRLTVDEGIALLARHRPDAAEPRHREAVAAIVEHLDGFAVALAAVGVYATHRDGFDWGRYHAALRDRPLNTVDRGEARAEEDGEQRRYRARAVAVFDDTLALLAERRPDTRRALDHAALLPEAGFPLPWLAWLTARAGVTATNDPGVDPAAAPGAGLLADGLLRPAPDGFVALHRWLREVVRAGLDETRRAALFDDLFALGWARGTACRDAVLQPALRPELTPLLTLAVALRAAGRLGEAARVLNRVGEPLYDVGRFAALHDALAPLAGPAGHCLGPADDGEGAAVLSHLGGALKALGQLSAAHDRHEQALAAADRHHGPDHAAVAAVRSNLAMVLRDLGELPAARRHLEAAIELDTRHLGPDHLNLATRYHNLAHVALAEGDPAAARVLWQQALTIAERALPPAHPHIRLFRDALADLDPPPPT